MAPDDDAPQVDEGDAPTHRELFKGYPEQMFSDALLAYHQHGSGKAAEIALARKHGASNVPTEATIRRWVASERGKKKLARMRRVEDAEDASQARQMVRELYRHGRRVGGMAASLMGELLKGYIEDKQQGKDPEIDAAGLKAVSAIWDSHLKHFKPQQAQQVQIDQRLVVGGWVDTMVDHAAAAAPVIGALPVPGEALMPGDPYGMPA